MNILENTVGINAKNFFKEYYEKIINIYTIENIWNLKSELNLIKTVSQVFDELRNKNTENYGRFIDNFIFDADFERIKRAYEYNNTNHFQYAIANIVGSNNAIAKCFEIFQNIFFNPLKKFEDSAFNEITIFAEENKDNLKNNNYQKILEDFKIGIKLFTINQTILNILKFYNTHEFFHKKYNNYLKTNINNYACKLQNYNLRTPNFEFFKPLEKNENPYKYFIDEFYILQISFENYSALFDIYDSHFKILQNDYNLILNFLNKKEETINLEQIKNSVIPESLFLDNTNLKLEVIEKQPKVKSKKSKENLKTVIQENENTTLSKKTKNTKKSTEKEEIKTKKQTIPPSLKIKVWNKYNTAEVGKAKCFCCKLHDIYQCSFSCGHVISEDQGGKLTLQNLRPICASCNSSMGTKNMDDYIAEFGF